MVRKVKRAVTDSDGAIRFDPEEKPGVSNLLSIYCACSGETMEDALRRFEGKGYGDLKGAVSDAVVAVLEPLQQRYAQYMSDKAYLGEVIEKGAQQAAKTAYRTLGKVYRKVGLAPRKL